jgi:homoserine dehydrogenase
MFNDPAFRSQSTHAPSGMPIAPLRVGMIGMGTVGLGTWRVLQRNQDAIRGRAGRGIEVVAVAVRNLERAAAVLGEGHGVELTDDPLRVATHPEVDVLVEVAGGTGPARDWLLAAMAHGKHVVTANKALLAEQGEALFAAAHQHGVALAYEGAVAVSIPIIKALREGLSANQIEWVAGIVNGTTNYILTRMREAGLDFEAALAEAQTLGYAEADPRLDVEGGDAAHKTALLAANAFGMPVPFEQVHVEGIRDLQALDVQAAQQLGYAVKLLGIARRVGAAVELRVHPALVPAQHLLAPVNGAMNAVLVKGDAAGLTMYYGAGAGSEPTGSAVIADLVDLARQTALGARPSVPPLAFHADARAPRAVLPMAEVCTRHYLRVPLNRTAALTEVPQVLATHGVTLQSLVRHDGSPEVQALVLTQPVCDGAVQQAVAALQALPGCTGPVAHLRVEWLD